MPKNIVICCDGTGNEVSATDYTNVVKLYRVLKKGDPARQVNYYDPGLGTLGTPGFRTRTFTSLTRLFGLATGYGLEDNVKDAYQYLMRTYEDGDRIFLFGFSRGAYTVRALSGMIRRVGLLERGNDHLVEHAIKRYFERVAGTPDWKGMGRFKKIFSRKVTIHFIGVWDTVKSVGLFSWSRQLPHTRDMKGVRHGRHALALNEKRSKFRPNVWSPPNDGKFAQVWFAGVHADVGGSYPVAGLSDVTLAWMLGEAAGFGLLLDTAGSEPLQPDPMGRMHNSLLPIWWLAGWWTRRIARPSGGAPVWVHESVRARRQGDARFDKACRRQLPDPVQYVATVPVPVPPSS